MADVIITPSELCGAVTVPPSKSDVHRAIICAALARGKSRISPVALSNDIKATIGCIEALGAKTQLENDTLTVDGTNTFTNKNATLDCFESGSTLRFLIPVAASGGVTAEFIGQGRLPERPIGIYTEALPKSGVDCKTQGGLPLVISGKLKSGEFEIPGDVSSQFITGLLLALPLCDGDSKIILTSPLESAAYIDITIDVMKKFGVKAQKTDYGYFVEGNQEYVSCDYKTHGDWSQAAFFMVAGALKGEITVNSVDITSSQGDKEIAEILKRFGAEVTLSENSVTVKHKELIATDIDASQIPDLVPILTVAAAFAKGTTNITNAGRLRIKESDRLSAIADALNSVGAMVFELSDGLVIEGKKQIHKGTVNGCNDHRIVMAMSIATLMSTDDITISDAQSINKSYPTFFEDYNKLGGKANVIDLG